MFGSDGVWRGGFYSVSGFGLVSGRILDSDVGFVVWIVVGVGDVGLVLSRVV